MKLEYEIIGNGRGKCVIYQGSVIDDAYFHECTDFSEIEFPDSLKVIGKEAFMSCYYLTSVTIPKSVTKIGERAFSDCSRIVSIIVDENNPSYCSLGNACLTKDRKTLVFGCKMSRVPNDVKRIGKGAFEGAGLEALTIPHGVRIIDDYAFFANHYIESLKLPNSLKKIGKFAFSQCDELTSIRIPGNVTTIGEEAFSWCRMLEKVTFGSGTKSIGKYAFMNCRVTEIKIPRSVEKIGKNAFSECDHLSTLYLPPTVKEIGVAAFGQTRIRDLYLSSSPSSYKWLIKAFDNGRFGFSAGRNNIQKKRFYSKIFGFSFGCWSDITLHVPKKTVNAYKSHPFFGEFKDIVPR